MRSGRGTRRVWGTVLAGLVTLVALASCAPGTPKGVDGDLTNNWQAMPEAAVPVPVAGSCYSEQYTQTWTGDFAATVVSCTAPHWTETVFVGTFGGDVASRSVPPLSGSSDLATAFTTCSTKAKDFLGGEWQAAYTWLGLTLPDNAAWKGGARWYRCELTQIGRDENEEDVRSSASAKGALTGSKPLARTCELVQDDGTSITSTQGIECAQPHNAEFAGLYTLTGSTYPGDSKVDSQASTACGRVMASYVGLSSTRSNYFGWYWHRLTEDEWNLGIRTNRCYVLGFASNGRAGNVRFTGSVKGLGSKKPAGWHT